MHILQVKQGKSLVVIDASNLHYSLKEAGWQIDYIRLYNFLKSKLNDFIVYFYDGYPPKNMPPLINSLKEETDNFDRKERKFRFFDKLKQIGYNVETKPITSIYDSIKGDYKNKSNFDVEITITAIDKINTYNSFLLFSGDGDFTKLIKYLKGKFKQTIVISTKKRTSASLMKAANVFINLNTMKDLIERKQKALP